MRLSRDLVLGAQKWRMVTCYIRSTGLARLARPLHSIVKVKRRVYIDVLISEANPGYSLRVSAPVWSLRSVESSDVVQRPLPFGCDQ